jgi:hypothetical protein
MDRPPNDKPPGEEESDSDRRAANIFMLVAGILVVGGGIWLANALVDWNRNQACLESGRHNCNPIEIERSRN